MESWFSIECRVKFCCWFVVYINMEFSVFYGVFKVLFLDGILDERVDGGGDVGEF